MGAKCCCIRKGFVIDSVTTSPNREELITDVMDTTREEKRDVVEPSEPTLPIPTVITSQAGEITEFVPSVLQGETLTNLAQESGPNASQGETSSTRELPANPVQESVTKVVEEETSNARVPPEALVQDEGLCYRASNILWTARSFSDPIPHGFYSVIPDNRLKHFESIPTLDQLRAMRIRGLKADVILVDLKKDNKVSLMKDLINTSANGVYSTPDKVKKIADVVVDVYTNATKLRQVSRRDDIPKLGEIKQASCHNRAIWFKILADSVGLESKLVVGCPKNLRWSSSLKSFNHMSVVVKHNNVEWLVDLVSTPGKLIPMSTYMLCMAHISAAEDGSCALPLTINRPIYSDYERALQARKRCIEKRKQRDNVSGLHIGDAQDQDVSKIWNNVFKNKPLPEECYVDISDLTVGTRVGSGCYGNVFRGMWNGMEVAIKKPRKQDLTEDIKDFCNEIYILSHLKHPNVIQFLGVCTKPPQLSLVTEFMERGSLHDVIRSNGKKLSWPMKLKMLRDICRGMKYIHEMGIVHRDLKSANCLVANDWTVKICDFGLSEIMEGRTGNGSIAGTPPWIAPEVYRKAPLTEKSDIFSFGVIMWELCTLSQPWIGVRVRKILNAVAEQGARLEIPEGPLRKLIADCWLEPEQRPSCDEILTYLETCEDVETEQTPS